jgi:hypothetical protein
MKNKLQNEPAATDQRLCSEIQLFDLCDLEGCHFKNDRFCSNAELISKFESIKDEDDIPDLVYTDDDYENDDESDFEEYNDDYEGDDE